MAAEATPKPTEALLPDLSVEFCGIRFKNPVIAASGTFGYGVEYEGILDLSTLGGLVSKGLYMEPRDGCPTPRIAETPSGLLNAIGDGTFGVTKRPADGGRGLDGVIERADGYWNPAIEMLEPTAMEEAHR